MVAWNRALRPLLWGWISFWVLGLALPASAQQSKLSGPALLALAANQQVLAERIARSYAMFGQGLLIERASYQIDQDVSRFERQLRSLQAAVPAGGEIAQNYGLLEQLWGQFRALVKESPNPKQAERLAELNEEVVWIAQKGAQLIERDFKVARAAEIVLVSEGSTLSQRLAKLYLLRGGGVKTEVVLRDLTKARADFLTVLTRLRASPNNTPPAKRELQLVDQQWLFLAQALDAPDNAADKQVLKENVAKASDNVLRALEGLNAVYLRDAGVKS